MTALAWTAQQQAFAAALLDPRAAPPESVTTHNGAAVAARFDVYRNNVHTSLIDALLATFPVTAQLVSEDSFRVLAREFLRCELPRQAALHDYGSGLPAFLRSWAPAASTAYLPDVAALEQAWWQAYGAADAPALRLHDFAAVDGEQLLALHARLHPATRLIDSAHPVHSIWAAHQAAGEPAPLSDWQAECVLITRPTATVKVRRMARGEHDFLAALDTGATLEWLAGAALARDAQFDLGTTLRLAIEAGAIQELHP
jgi:hypothetical protein